jgi:tRNA-specific 2-thiouridylase
MKKCLAALSGGVDSAAAAWLLQEQGYTCTGAMMKVHNNSDGDALQARAVAARLGIPFHVFDFTGCFEKTVIRPFIHAYQNGETPNPCAVCNQKLKFGSFLTRAAELGINCMATGHYARVVKESGGRYLLLKGFDKTKDQSYVLFGLNQSQLSRILFPLGGLTKAQVREIAAAQGFPNAAKPDSQDICFIPGGDYAGFIGRYTGHVPECGNFTDTGGNVLGRHRGIIHYTVGQRKGLGLSAPEPWYVCRICPDDNTVVLGKAGDVYTKALTARGINLIAADQIDGALRVHARIRYSQPEQPATVLQTGPDTIRVEFDAPQRAAAKGQAVVLYDGDTVIGGGTIDG